VELKLTVLAMLFLLGAVASFVQVSRFSRVHHRDVRASEGELVHYGLICPEPIISRLALTEQSYWLQLHRPLITGSVLVGLALITFVLSFT
jgi:hypothetical protein